MHQPIPLYHLTHIRNLASIIECGELRCYNLLAETGIGHADIAYQHIQDRRKHIPVSYWPGGVLHDYVPFYFGPRSPMLYAIHGGYVPSYPEGQQPLIYLVTTVEAVEAQQLPFVFTDGNATVAITEFFNEVDYLEHSIDWQVIKAVRWNNTSEDPDRKRRRQAEFLVHNSCPWYIVEEVGVINAQMQQRVAHMLETTEHRPPVVVHRDWYY